MAQSIEFGNQSSGGDSFGGGVLLSNINQNLWSSNNIEKYLGVEVELDTFPVDFLGSYS